MNLSNLSNLQNLNASNNNIATLNLNGCTSLFSINVNNNILSSLDVSPCTSLEILYLDNNNLQGNLTGLSNMSTSLVGSKSISIQNNNMTTQNIEAVFTQLPTQPIGASFEWSIYIGNNSGTNSADRNIALNKGWVVYPPLPTPTPTPTFTPTPTPTPTQPPETWDVGIQTTAINQTFGVQLNGTSPNITIDWGEGTVENFTTTGNKTKTYSNIGNYTVKIYGNFGSNGSIRLGTTTTERSRVKSTSYIPTIIGLSNSFANYFNGCNSLTSLPSNLFANYNNVTSFSNCFRGCSSLTALPATLFAANTAVTDFGSCFVDCGSITSIPENLFVNNTLAVGFRDCFYNCDGFSTIPAGLFANNINITDFQGCFGACNSLTSVPSTLFANNTAVTNFSYCFVSSTSLTSVPSTLFANNTDVTTFAFCFQNLTLSTTSYSDLLINMATNASSRKTNVPFHGGFSKYNINGETARNTLINTKTWSFIDGGLA